MEIVLFMNDYPEIE